MIIKFPNLEFHFLTFYIYTKTLVLYFSCFLFQICLSFWAFPRVAARRGPCVAASRGLLSPPRGRSRSSCSREGCDPLESADVRVGEPLAPLTVGGRCACCLCSASAGRDPRGEVEGIRQRKGAKRTGEMRIDLMSMSMLWQLWWFSACPPLTPP